jgi:fluoride exporter
VLLHITAICLGASMGALARWALGLWLSTGGALPWGTLAANLIGGYLVGICVAVFQSHPQIDPVWRLALVTGFLGALTTFSTFSAESVALLQQGRFATALAHSGLHLLGSLLATWLGIRSATLFIAACA